ncbi:S1C family serine protease [Yinghuangia aomiensis]
MRGEAWEAAGRDDERAPPAARRGRGRRTAAFVLAAGLVAGAAACSDSDSGGSTKASGTPAGSPGSPSASAAAATPPGGSSDLQANYRKVVADVLPSVVQITTDSGLGSGIVYDTSGNIVTNAHVVGNATTFQVTLATGTQPLTAKLVSSYPPNDVAVVRLDNPPSGLKPAQWDDSSKLARGHHRHGDGQPARPVPAVSAKGIVSALNRTQNESSDGGGTGATIPNLIQTTAAINPGQQRGRARRPGQQGRRHPDAGPAATARRATRWPRASGSRSLPTPCGTSPTR